MLEASYLPTFRSGLWLEIEARRNGCPWGQREIRRGCDGLRHEVRFRSFLVHFSTNDQDKEKSMAIIGRLCFHLNAFPDPV